MASAMHDPWISGMAGGSYQFRAEGTDAATFWQSAEGAVRFDLREGALVHISLATDGGPLQFAHWDGRLRLHDGKIEIEKGAMISAGEAYEVSGTASFGQVLDFTLTGGTEMKAARAPVYSITGTVAEPRVAVTPTAETQAQLKP
jgi:hypothetical protein